MKSRLVRTKGQVSEQIRVERSVICTGEENPTWTQTKRMRNTGEGRGRTQASPPRDGRHFLTEATSKRTRRRAAKTQTWSLRAGLGFFKITRAGKCSPNDTTRRELLSCCSDVMKKLDNPSVSLQPREKVQQGAAARD